MTPPKSSAFTSSSNLSSMSLKFCLDTSSKLLKVRTIVPIISGFKSKSSFNALRITFISSSIAFRCACFALFCAAVRRWKAPGELNIMSSPNSSRTFSPTLPNPLLEPLKNSSFSFNAASKLRCILALFLDAVSASFCT